MEFIPYTTSDFCSVDSITANITKLGHICVLFVIFLATLADFFHKTENSGSVDQTQKKLTVLLNE